MPLTRHATPPPLPQDAFDDRPRRVPHVPKEWTTQAAKEAERLLERPALCYIPLPDQRSRNRRAVSGLTTRTTR